MLLEQLEYVALRCVHYLGGQMYRTYDSRCVRDGMNKENNA